MTCKAQIFENHLKFLYNNYKYEYDVPVIDNIAGSLPLTNPIELPQNLRLEAEAEWLVMEMNWGWLSNFESSTNPALLLLINQKLIDGVLESHIDNQ